MPSPESPALRVAEAIQHMALRADFLEAIKDEEPDFSPEIDSYQHWRVDSINDPHQRFEVTQLKRLDQDKPNEELIEILNRLSKHELRDVNILAANAYFSDPTQPVDYFFYPTGEYTPLGRMLRQQKRLTQVDQLEMSLAPRRKLGLRFAYEVGKALDILKSEGIQLYTLDLNYIFLDSNHHFLVKVDELASTQVDPEGTFREGLFFFDFLMNIMVSQHQSNMAQWKALKLGILFEEDDGDAELTEVRQRFLEMLARLTASAPDQSYDEMRKAIFEEKMEFLFPLVDYEEFMEFVFLFQSARQELGGNVTEFIRVSLEQFVKSPSSWSYEEFALQLIQAFEEENLL